MTITEQTALELLVTIGKLERHIESALQETIDEIGLDEKRATVEAFQPLRDGVTESERRLRSVIIGIWGAEPDDADLLGATTVSLNPADVPRPWDRYAPPEVVDLDAGSGDDE